MTKIGASIYLHLTTLEQLTSYTQLLGENKVQIIFTTLINFKPTEKEQLKKLIVLTTTAKKYNMDVYVDINQEFIDNFKLNITKRDDFIKWFKNQGFTGIRCDEGIAIQEQAKLSQNKLNFKIIINGSHAIEEVERLLLQYNANAKNLISCYNFYPQRYTGADIEFFSLNQAESIMNKIPFASFVTLLGKDKVGPWAYNDNLPALEMHRDWPLTTQIRHYVALCLDMIIVANQFLTEDDLVQMNNIDYETLSLNIQLSKNVTNNEKTIIFDDNIHIVRPDLAQDLIRSSMPRITYKDLSIPNQRTNEWLEIGDVVILNNDAQNYRGELHIITNKIKNDGIRNVVGKLAPKDLNFIPYLVSNRPFKFIGGNNHEKI
ncbi:MupG family TIM beta-alpha barrel fold protein [Spiroplasma endosymbiont of Virgichneumon dumeticola]|uniref:MupG family TIM beta-alpha barrel fold protein n=1 Tax=Spiroplasma endosymbiont of Virgichneumon dumeticola TaxID=3139323 RepID=UPI0035C88FC6